MASSRRLSVPKAQLKKWINALRSGKYKQGKRALENDDGSFCCLGVACKVLLPKEKQNIAAARNLLGELVDDDDQPNAPSWLKNISNDVARRAGEDLAALNDNGAYNGSVEPLTFNEIADVLEAVYIHKAV